MAAKYLLECPCGAKHPVSTHQAGSELTCQCGQKLAVPRLRELQKLPQEEAPAASSTSTRWSGGHSLALAGVILMVGSLIGAYWAHRKLPSLEHYQEVMGQRSVEVIDEWLDTAPPAELFHVWQQVVIPTSQTGFTDELRSDERQVESWEAQGRILRNGGLVLAGLGLLLAIAGMALAGQRR